MAEWAWASIIGSVALIALVALAIALRGDRAKGRKRCPKCWYSMDGLDTLQCPECGRKAKNERKLRRPRRKWKLAILALTLLAGCAAGAAYRVSDSDPWLRAIPNWPLVLIALEPDYQAARQAQANAAAPAPVIITRMVGGPNANPLSITPNALRAPGRPAQLTAQIRAQLATPPAPVFAPPGPKPPATPLWERLINRLQQELARRHIEGELNAAQTRSLLLRAVPDLNDIDRDDFLWTRDAWARGIPYCAIATPPDLPDQTGWTDHFALGVRILRRGEDISHRVLGAERTDNPIVPNDTEHLTACFQVLDRYAADRVVWSRTFPYTITATDDLTDLLRPMEDWEVEYLLERALVLRYRNKEGYVAYITPGTEMFGNVFEGCELASDGGFVMGFIPLCERCIAGWPKINIAPPGFILEGAQGEATISLRNVPARLLADPSCERCLPLEGVTFTFRELLDESEAKARTPRQARPQPQPSR